MVPWQKICVDDPMESVDLDLNLVTSLERIYSRN